MTNRNKGNEYIQLIKTNVQDIFTETETIKTNELVFYTFSNKTKEKIIDYVITTVNDKYIESMIISQSLLMHYVQFKNNETSIIDLTKDIDYLIVKYVLIPMYTCFISEKIFGLTYPDEFTLMNISEKSNVLEQIKMKISTYDNDTFKQYLIGHIDELFFVPIVRIVDELVIGLDEFETLEDILTNSGKVIFSSELKNKFRAYLSQRLNDLFYPEYEIPKSKDEMMIFSNLTEALNEIGVRLEKLQKRMYESVSKHIIELDVNDVSNDFFRKRIFGSM